MEEKDSGRKICLPENWAADWMLEEKLGSGAYSSVWRAVRRDNPSVDAAIKIISIPSGRAEAAALMGEGLDREQAQEYYDGIARQYIREIDMLEEFKGTPNIVSIEDYRIQRKQDEIGNELFIRMELLTPLDHVLQKKILNETEIIRIGIDICSALELCESRHIIHRDIKPANIFVNNKMPEHVFYKLGDFGIARSMENLTSSLSAKGTPSYMAPEVFLGRPYDNRADLYSLGITLYRMMNNNRLPLVPDQGFSAVTREAALSRRMSGEKLPPPCRGSESVNRVILKACAFDPNQRYATASRMKKDLEAALRGEPVENGFLFKANEPAAFRPAESPAAAPAVPVPAFREPVSTEPVKPRKRPGRWIALALVVLALAIGAWTLLDPPGPFPPSVATETPAPTPEVTTPAPTPTPEPTPTPTNTPTPKPTDTPTPTPVPTVDPKRDAQFAVDHTVTYGTYPQTEEGTDSTPIEWIVLDRDGDRALLISKYGLDQKRYHDETASVTWETCNLRTWLNSDFLQQAFSPEEQAAILTTDVDNSDAQGYGEWNTDGGNNTQDRVFLLSYAEAHRYFGVTYDNDENMEARLAPTDWAIENGAYAGSDIQTADGKDGGWWWLRSPGIRHDHAAYIRTGGALFYCLVEKDYGCVRPAMWISLIPSDVPETPAPTPAPSPEATPEPTQELTVGNHVLFGTYPQTAEGTDNTPIEWIVLDRDGDKVLLISQYELDARPYNEKSEGVTWETCTLRAWLNGDFLQDAFSTEEQAAILTTIVDNSAAQ